MKAKDVIELAKKNDAKFVDLKFIDFPGVWQHTTIPIQRLDEGLFEDGLAFDGSSVRGWQPINAPDLTMGPGPETAKMAPFLRPPADLAHLLRLRSDHEAAVLARPAPHRAQGRGLRPADRHRRHVVHG